MSDLGLCPECGGTGSVRIHGPEDYGISFESEDCERCGGYGSLGETEEERRASEYAAEHGISRQRFCGG